MSRRIEVGDLTHSTYSLIVKVLHRILKWAKGRGYTAIDSIPDLAL
ncbi:MAG: hypothetical protein VYE73_13080 [Acidobacteriota bacterium]|nr:hypothetical protein [Acidobacteriota bacterium]